MPIHLHDSANLKRPFLLQIQTIGLDIHSPITGGVYDVRDTTRKYASTPSTILYLYRLFQHNSSVNHLLDSPLLLQV